MTERDDPTGFETTELQLKTMLRNAMMIAGREMGKDGDHWPVVKNTITDVMNDWQRLEAERAVNKEVSKALYKELAALEAALAQSPPSVRKSVAPRLAELREVYDAAFFDPEVSLIDLRHVEDGEENDKPLHIRRAEAIIGTLFEDISEERTHA